MYCDDTFHKHARMHSPDGGAKFSRLITVASCIDFVVG